MNCKKDDLDRLGREQMARAERDKKRIYRELLDEQQRLVTHRKQMRRQQELDEDREMLAVNSDIVQSKIREQDQRELETRVREFPSEMVPKSKRTMHLAGCTLADKMEYEKMQSEILQRDRMRINMENGEEDMRNTLRASKIGTQLSHLYGGNQTLKLEPHKDPGVTLEKPDLKTQLNLTPAKVLQAKKEKFNPEELERIADIYRHEAEQQTYPVIDVPYHSTRRHYKSIAHLKQGECWKYDPEPAAKAAGLPNRLPNFNPINGVRYFPEDITSSSPSFKPLPEFMKNKYEVSYPVGKPTNSIYDRIRSQGHNSNIFG